MHGLILSCRSLHNLSLRNNFSRKRLRLFPKAMQCKTEYAMATKAYREMIHRKLNSTAQLIRTFHAKEIHVKTHFQNMENISCNVLHVAYNSKDLKDSWL